MHRSNLAYSKRCVYQSYNHAPARRGSSETFTQMILVASPSKPFDYNAKGNVRRGPILQRYAAEIDALYASVEESVQVDIAAPSSWDPESTKSFVKAVLQRVLLRPLLHDDADFFRSGCDRCPARSSVLRWILTAIHMHAVCKQPGSGTPSCARYGRRLPT